MGNKIQQAYGVGAATIPVFPIPISALRAPISGQDVSYPQGQAWFDNSVTPAIEYIYDGKGTWVTGTPGSLSQLNGDSGSAVPSGGIITLSGGTTGLTESASGSTVTLGGTLNVAHGGTGAASLTAHGVLIGEGTSAIVATATGTTGFPLVAQGASADPIFTVLGVAGGGTGASSFTAHGVLVGEGTGPISPVTGSTGQVLVGVTGADPSFTGSPSVSGSLTAGTTVTATLGNVTATAGNFVSSTAGNGIVLNSGTASGTTTATLNGRSGQVTITTPSIAAGATFSFALTNSSITGSTTQVLYGLTGGTTGSAITIQSVTNSANTSTIVVQNASAVTNNTGSLVLTFLVLN